MIERLKGLTMPQRAAIAIGAIALAMAAIACAGALAPAQEAPEAHEGQEAGAQEGQEGQEEAQDADPDSLLPVDAKAIRAAYTADEQEFVGVLESNSWASQDGSEIVFKDSTMTRSDPKAGASEAAPYVVTAIDRQRYTGKAGTYDVTVASIVMPDATSLMRLEHVVGKGESWMLYSDALPSASGYSRQAPAAGLSIKGDIEKMLGLLGGTTGTLRGVIADMCALYYPSASVATWTGEADADWESKTVSTRFALNNTAKTHLNVVYHMDTGAYEMR